MIRGQDIHRMVAICWLSPSTRLLSCHKSKMPKSCRTSDEPKLLAKRDLRVFFFAFRQFKISNIPTKENVYIFKKKYSPFKIVSHQLLLNIENANGSIGRACRQFEAIIVERCVVLSNKMSNKKLYFSSF